MIHYLIPLGKDIKITAWECLAYLKESQDRDWRTLTPFEGLDIVRNSQKDYFLFLWTFLDADDEYRIYNKFGEPIAIRDGEDLPHVYHRLDRKEEEEEFPEIQRFRTQVEYQLCFTSWNQGIPDSDPFEWTEEMEVINQMLFERDLSHPISRCYISIGRGPDTPSDEQPFDIDGFRKNLLAKIDAAHRCYGVSMKEWQKIVKRYFTIKSIDEEKRDDRDECTICLGNDLMLLEEFLLKLDRYEDLSKKGQDLRVISIHYVQGQFYMAVKVNNIADLSFWNNQVSTELTVERLEKLYIAKMLAFAPLLSLPRSLCLIMRDIKYFVKESDI